MKIYRILLVMAGWCYSLCSLMEPCDFHLFTQLLWAYDIYFPHSLRSKWNLLPHKLSHSQVTLVNSFYLKGDNRPLHPYTLFIFSSSSSCTLNLLSECTKVCILFTFASLLCIFGCPFLIIVHTFALLFHPYLCHLKTLNFIITCLP